MWHFTGVTDWMESLVRPTVPAPRWQRQTLPSRVFALSPSLSLSLYPYLSISLRLFLSIRIYLSSFSSPVSLSLRLYLMESAHMQNCSRPEAIAAFRPKVEKLEPSFQHRLDAFTLNSKTLILGRDAQTHHRLSSSPVVLMKKVLGKRATSRWSVPSSSCATPARPQPAPTPHPMNWNGPQLPCPIQPAKHLW